MLTVNQFSAHIYNTLEQTKTNEFGEVFVKSGDDFYGMDGQYIQKTGESYTNIKTGVNSTFGDPFGESNA